jgi:class 3 adenylate cyclase
MTDLQNDAASGAEPGRDEEELDRPEAYIASDRRRALAAGRAMPDRVHGAALFADISGFTPLTEALANELGAQRGAEELTANLNRVFHALIEDLHRCGGNVIYFSGDAITCWLDGDDGARAAMCGLAMQRTMDRLREVVTPGGAKVRLAMKVAIAVGPARRFLVGDPDVQRIDVLAGRLIDQLAAAERLANRGEVVLEQSALEALGDRVDVAETRADEASARRCGVLERMTVAVADARKPAADAELPEDIVR